ncbi:cell division protein FtsQ/DivIB [Acidaminococcus timonensis]|uniref:cell division protein FtsQ/DivIB n=1 Tax=Acidaminococcus TaxID=904 RepID=UPI0026F0CA66|nr:cell division protein FtsQ/DivIB [Acidaminococcus timonensis]
MNRPKWLRPRVGQNRRRPGTRDADIRREEELRQAEREAEGTPGHRSFRQEMRAARLRQEEARKKAEEEARARRKVRLEAQAYINGQADSPEPEPEDPVEQARKARLERQRARRLGRKRSPQPEPETKETGRRLRRRKPKRRLNKAKVALLVASIALLIASYVLLHQPWLAFGQLQVVGDTAVTLDEVKEMGDAEEPLNIFNINRKKLLSSLRSDYRVEKADLSLGWPNILKVVITDRKPALYVAMEGGQYAKVDPTGHIIGLADGITGGDAPFVSGWHISATDLGGVTDDEEIQGILKFLNQLDDDLKQRINEIHVDDSQSIRIYLRNGIPVILGSPDNAVAKLKTFKAICQELETKKIKAQYIDLTYEKPYIKL